MNADPLRILSADCGSAFSAESAADCRCSTRLGAERQNLITPLNAIIELSELVARTAEDRGLRGLFRDLTKVHAAGQRLAELARAILDPSKNEPDPVRFRQRLRHELCNPLNCVVGYCEIWLEDVAELPQGEFADDLSQIRTLAREVLSRIDEMLGFAEASPSAAGGGDVRDRPDPVEGVFRWEAPPGGEETLRPSQKGAILVAEDVAINRDLLYRRLSRDGHEVVLARDGQEALRLIEARPFDLLLLDIVMPEMNGFQVLERLKADERYRHIPVLMISAFNDTDSIARCIEMGAEDYLTKPFNPILLRSRINASLEKKKWRDREIAYRNEIERERHRSDELLRVILPEDVIGELKATKTVKPRRCENVAVLFCDIVDFTPYCDRNQPECVFAVLQPLVEAWETIALGHGMDKIKTIGDAFMATAGLISKTDRNPVLTSLRCGLDMIAAVNRVQPAWDVRVGIDCGAVVAGVLGRRQYLFDLWGDTVNTAARVERYGVPGAVTLSGNAWQQVQPWCRGVSLGLVDIKGKGPLELFRFEAFRDG